MKLLLVLAAFIIPTSSAFATIRSTQRVGPCSTSSLSLGPGVSVSIGAGSDRNDCKVSAAGYYKCKITENDCRKLFGIENDSTLKDILHRGMLEYHPGKKDYKITSVHLEKPALDSNGKEVYTDSNASRTPVAVTFRPKHAKILSFNTQRESYVVAKLENHSSKTVTESTETKHEISYGTSTSWNTGNELRLDQNIHYGLEFLGTGVSGETSFGYSRTWGYSGEESKTTTVGSSAGVSVELEPNQKVQVEILATKNSFDVEVEYEATLEGGVVSFWKDSGITGLFPDYWWWSWTLNGVLDYGNLPTRKSSKEKITVDYFSDISVKVFDIESDAEIAFYDAASPVFNHDNLEIPGKKAEE